MTKMTESDLKELAVEYLQHDGFMNFTRYMHSECLVERKQNNEQGLEFYEYYFQNFEYLLNEYKKHMEKYRQ